MTVLRALLPSLVVVLLTLLAALPWGLGGDMRLAVPLLPTVVLFAWNLRRRNAVPEVIAFLAGIALDALSQGPLGYWALLNLTAFAAASAMRGGGADASLPARWLTHAAGMVAIAVIAWGVSSLYAMQASEVRPLAIAVGLAVATWPLLAAVIAMLDPRPGAANGNLVRGG
jgi:rod shape-determining protein MreD